MKIKNDLISVKIGKKQYDFTNLILDEYLKRFVNSQLDETKTRSMSNIKDLECCLIKFDTPFTDIQSNSEIHNQEFDICLVGNLEYAEELGEKQITVRYKYSSSFIWDYEKATAQNITISNYYGKKITAIGFNVWWGSDENFETKLPVCAILDVSNYNIYLQKNQNLEVVRKDIITTDAEFWSNSDKVKSPAHLTPKGIPAVLKQEDIVNEDGSVSKFNINAFGILYSIGLSSYTDYIDKEFVIGRDVQLEQNDAEIIIKGIENYFSTDNPLFLDNSKLFTDSDLYPIKSNYKYMLFKYKVWQEVVTRVEGQDVYTPTDTETYYYQAIPIDKFGKNNFTIKYERS